MTLHLARPRPTALVVGDLSLVRALGKSGIPVALAHSAPSSATRSRYLSDVVAVRDVVDDPNGCVDDVIAWARRQPVAPVIFCQGDHDLLAFSRRRDDVSKVARLPLPPAQLVEDLVDKVRFAQLAQRTSLPTPTTTTLMPGPLLAAQAAAFTSFPAVLKPAVRSGWERSPLNDADPGSKAARIESREALLKKMSQLEAFNQPLLLQQAIDGGEDRIVSYHAFVDDDGVLRAEFTGKKVRTSPRRYGHSTFVEITDEADVRALGRSVCKAIGFTGVLKMDLKRDPQDRLWLLEINPRFSLWHHAATVAGAAIPALVYDRCVGRGRAAGAASDLVVARKGVRWMSARSDLHAFAEHKDHGEVSLLSWLLDVASADVNEDFSFSDPLPALIELRGIATRRMRRLLTLE